MAKTPPPIREEEFGIQIDQEKGEYPFLQAVWGSNSKGKTRLIVIGNSNERGDVVGTGTGVSVLALSPKKVVALRDFLTRTLDALE